MILEGASALDEFHDDVRIAVDLARVVDPQYVRVVENARRLRLVEEHLPGAPQIRFRSVSDRAYLDRDLAFDERIVADVHGSHTTFAGHPEDLVLSDLARRVLHGSQSLG